ncbi:MAG: ABC transporter substrate-binding protein [Rhizobiales bacterium]|nr:ABC transporter substrate-binding protein [Hyphomicrobiales bacterium]
MVEISRRNFSVAALLASAAPLRAAETPSRGGVLNLVVQPEPATLALGLNLQAPTIYVGGKIFQGLLTYSDKLEPRASLARSWTISADGLTYSFTLQDNVRWHDGKAFSADDVVFTAGTFLRETHPRWRLIFDSYVAGVTATAKDTVVFQLKKPFSAFLYAFELSSLPIIPKHIYEGTDYRTNPANLAPIGTGPFKFKSWRRGQHIQLVRNEDYWKQGRPFIDEIFFRVIPDAASRAIAFDRKIVDVLRSGDAEGFEIRRISAQANVVSTTKGEEMYAPHAFLQMNLRRAPFDNKLVRKAVMHALNRDFIARNIWFGSAAPARGAISSSTRFYDENVVQYPYDLKLAKELIGRSGVDLAALKLKLLPLPYGQQWDRLAEYIKQQLAQIGFDIAIQSTDVAGWSQAVSDWNFDVALNYTYQYGDPALGVARHYLSSNIIKGTPAANNHGYSNPVVDRLFAEAAGAVSEADARRSYAAVQAILADDVALGWLFEMKNVVVSRPSTRNLVTSAIGVSDMLDETWIAK